MEIFHAGTKADGARILANGGRVLNVCARGKTVREAQTRAYAAVDKIKWPDGFCRRDIGWRAIERANKTSIKKNTVLKLWHSAKARLLHLLRLIAKKNFEYRPCIAAGIGSPK